MILLLSLILITSIWVLGLTIATQENMVLYSWREWGNRKLEEGKWWSEPLILCLWCMSSIHSLVGYSFAIGAGIITSFEWKLIFIYPLVVMGSSLLNGIIWGIHKLIEAKTKYYINVETLTWFDISDRKKKHSIEKNKVNHH